MGELKCAIEETGGPAFVAANLGISVQRLCNWVDRESVPLEHCASLERATCGRIKRWHLRRDDWHRIWPELIGADGAPAVPEGEEAA